MHDARERYTLTIRALPDSAPPIIRLRRVIKGLLRAYGFRLLAVVQLHEDSPATAPTHVSVED